MRRITNTANIIHRRDIVERIDELREILKAEGDEAEELRALEKLAKQCWGFGSWDRGETLVHDAYFTEYVKYLAEEIGAVHRDGRWPQRFIDWEAAAEELKQDLYMAVDFDGETYWMRACTSAPTGSRENPQMTYSTIYDLDGNIIADGVQSQCVCDATINTARRLAADRKRSVVVEDRGTEECYRVTPAGLVWRAPKGWTNPFEAEDEYE